MTARNSDLTEGRGGTVFEEYFDDVYEAVEAARGISTQGSDGEVYEVLTVIPDDKIMVWGYHWIKELGISYSGFAPGSEWFDDEDIIRQIKQTHEYKKYVEQKQKYERYGL